MAVYKVPQDVEADDKLIGPFSFRQFVYLIIAAIGIVLGWALAQLFIPLAIVPLPIVIFFGALALPLKKDQPMETYLAAVVSFYLKPRKRLWQPDGIQSLVEITAPKVVEVQRAKNLSQSEAERRLSYLADIVDTGGWAVRGVGMPQTNTAMQTDAYLEAQQTEDILDESGGVAQSFDTMIDKADAKRRQEAVERMRQPVPPLPDPYASLATNPAPTSNAENDPHLTFNPYPTSIHQSVINPLGTQPLPQPPALVQAQPQLQAPVPQAAPAAAPVPAPQPILPTPAITPEVMPTAQPILSPEPPITSENVVSPDIINLANNSDLSIETIAHEAKRIHEKEEEKLPEDEVVISLR